MSSPVAAAVGSVSASASSAGPTGPASPGGGRARRPSATPSLGASSSDPSSSSSDEDDNDDGVSDTSLRPGDGANNPLPAMYHRRNEIDWRDPAVQEEMRELKFDPTRPFSPLAADLLPRFQPEPRPPYLELEPWQLTSVGLLYPDAEFLVCRLPVIENRVMLMNGWELARLGVHTSAEPIGVVMDAENVGEPGEDEKHHVRLDLGRLRFGLLLLRRDWPQGEVACLFDAEPYTDFVRRVTNTFGGLPQERLNCTSTQVVNGIPFRKWWRAFLPAPGRPRAPEALQRAWVARHVGVVPEQPSWRQQMRRAVGAGHGIGRGAPAAN